MWNLTVNLLYCCIGLNCSKFTTFIDAVKKNKHAYSKGVYLKSVTLTSTMGPGIKVENQAN